MFKPENMSGAVAKTKESEETKEISPNLVVPVKFVKTEWHDSSQYGNNPNGSIGSNYYPKFEENGKVIPRFEQQGLGVYEQNGKFYFSTFSHSRRDAAYRIPEKLARQISSSPLVEPKFDLKELWNNDETKLKEILEKFASE